MRTLFRYIKLRNPKLVFVTALCLGAILLGHRAASPKTPLINGKVCNNSSTDILILLAPGKIGPENIWITPGNCTNPNQDAEAIWAKQCDPTTGGCQIQKWKVGPYNIDIIDGQVSSVPPRNTLFIKSWCLIHCGWVTPSRKAKPNLDDLHYELRR